MQGIKFQLNFIWIGKWKLDWENILKDNNLGDLWTPNNKYKETV